MSFKVGMRVKLIGLSDGGELHGVIEADEVSTITIRWDEYPDQPTSYVYPRGNLDLDIVPEREE